MKPWIKFAREMRESGHTIAVTINGKSRHYFVVQTNKTVNAFWMDRLLEADLIRPLENCIDPKNPQEWEFAGEE